MQFTAKQISEFIDGTIEGDENVKVSELSKIENGKPGSLCFLSNPKYESYLYLTNASVVIVGKEFVPSQKVNSTLIRVEDPYSAFSVLLDKYNEVVNQTNAQVGIEQPSFIHPTAKIGKNVFIGAFCLYRRECANWRGQQNFCPGFCWCRYPNWNKLYCFSRR